MADRLEVALSAHQLSVQAGRKTLLDAVDCALPLGQWTAIVGPNGAGKSTLLHTLAGLQPRARWQGEIQLLGRSLAAWPERQRAKVLAWLGQNEAAALDMTCYDIVMLGRLPHQGWFEGPTSRDHVEVREAMETTQCWPWHDQPLGQLSGGERQRVLLARALAVQAKILLMDEPLANLDPPHQSHWMRTVKQLVAEQHTVVSVLHELGIALQSDHMLIVQAGQILHQGPTRDPQTHAALEQVFDGRISVCQAHGQWVALSVG